MAAELGVWRAGGYSSDTPCLVIPSTLVLEMFSIITMAARMIFRVIGIILQSKFIRKCVVVSKPLPNDIEPAAR
jgi:hypothetical protein